MTVGLILLLMPACMSFSNNIDCCSSKLLIIHFKVWADSETEMKYCRVAMIGLKIEYHGLFNFSYYLISKLNQYDQ